MNSGHLVPFFCPYCGEESIEPFGESAGGWVCGDCRRQFTLRSGVRAAASEKPQHGMSQHEVRTQ